MYDPQKKGYDFIIKLFKKFLRGKNPSPLININTKYKL